VEESYNNPMENHTGNHMEKITSKTTIKKILELENGPEILHKHGVPCMGCPMAQFEIDKLQIGQVCKVYGLPLKEIIEELNK